MTKFNENQWLSLKQEQRDDTDLGERVAPYGGLARIEDVFDRGANDISYEVVSWPSGVVDFWTDDDIEKHAVLLEPGHPDIPSQNEMNLVAAISNLYYDDAKTSLLSTGTHAILVSSNAFRMLQDSARSSSVENMVSDIFGQEYSAVAVRTDKIDALAAAVGVGYRFTPTETPFEGRVTSLFPVALVESNKKPKAETPTP